MKKTVAIMFVIISTVAVARSQERVERVAVLDSKRQNIVSAFDNITLDYIKAIKVIEAEILKTTSAEQAEVYVYDTNYNFSSGKLKENQIKCIQAQLIQLRKALDPHTRAEFTRYHSGVAIDLESETMPEAPTTSIQYGTGELHDVPTIFLWPLIDMANSSVYNCAVHSSQEIRNSIQKQIQEWEKSENSILHPHDGN